MMKPLLITVLILLTTCQPTKVAQQSESKIYRRTIATDVPVVEMGTDTMTADDLELLSAEELLFP